MKIMNGDGTMARMPDLIIFCNQHGLQIARELSSVRARGSKAASAGVAQSQ
jgi:3,4-dihydroxy-2-butanone 4-phosphate synthase